MEKGIYPIITLKKGKNESLQRRHPWVFSGAIQHSSQPLEEGELVDVYSAEGSFLARGYCEIGSIAVRVLTFKEEVIDSAFLKRRLESALDLRKKIRLIRSDNTIYRLVHGEGDFLPGLVVDVYGSVAVVQAHTIGMHLLRESVRDVLLQAPFSEIIKSVYYKSDTTLPFKAEVDFTSGLIGGEKFADNYALENGIKIYPDILRGQKTGFFVDQRENRTLLEHYSKGASVLNMFCYSGGFSIYALRGGAKRVVSVDSSAKAIEMMQRNIDENKSVWSKDATHEAYVEDAFRYLDRVEPGEFDVVVLDPPAFAKHRKVLHNALQGYRKLNVAAMSKMNSGSILFTFSCSQAVSPEQFRQAVFTAALQAGKQVRILHQLTQPMDHPVSIYHPEGEYLKGLVLYID